jgi:cytochrome bd ubiquinol oxidase subunit II
VAVSGALSLATLLEIHGSNPVLFHGLTHRALPLVIVSAACGLAVVVFLVTGRSLSVLGVTAVVWGWGVAQYPALLPGTGLTLTSGAAPHSILVTVVIVFVAAALLVAPSFFLLFSLHGRQLLEEGAAPTAPRGRRARRARPGRWHPGAGRRCRS